MSDGWPNYDAYSRHPFETSTGMEGGCHHCGGPARSVVHEKPWADPLPDPVPDTSKPDPELPSKWLLTATYDEPERERVIVLRLDYGDGLEYP